MTHLEQVRLKRSEEKVARIIAIPIALVLSILFYIGKIILKATWRVRGALWKVSVQIAIVFFLTQFFGVVAVAPKSDASVPYVAPHVLTRKEIIESKPYGDIVWRIYNLESSQGSNAFLYCQKQGLYNDFGFNVANKQCFASFEDEATVVSRWFAKELQTYSLGQALCLYNIGIANNSCEYAQHFLGL